MKKRLKTVVIVLAVVSVLVAVMAVQYRSRYPYGWSHCCILGMSLALENYAMDNHGRFPAGQTTPEGSLSLLYRSNYESAYTLRGMTVPEKTVRTILDSGQLLGPESCGWHYAEGLTLSDDPRLALLYCKQPLGHNGEKTRDGGRQVAFVDGSVSWISGEKWAAFLDEQERLLSQRDERAKTASPLVDASIELPDGRIVENVQTAYVLKSGGSDGAETESGGSFNRRSLVWFHAPYRDFSGFLTRTLSFSNLESGAVTVTFTNGIPDKTNVVFKMRTKP
jgi:prepilin-type processing-associated H-X9-DG protein